MRVFIGSSKEAKSSMNMVAVILEEAELEPVRWDTPSLFPAGTYTLERLIEISKEVDAAVLLMTEDDKVWYRGDYATQPRDNVNLEFGLFAGQHGPRSAIICVAGNPHLASDLHGLTVIPLDKANRARTELISWASELRVRASKVPFAANMPLGLARTTRVGNVFQDFDIKRPSGNISPVSRLWADAARANTISAAVDVRKRYLRIAFSNKAKSYPGNVTIRPQGGEALANPKRNRWLTFEARVPPPSPGSSVLLKEVGVALRIINVADQHWEYATSPREYVQFRATRSWRPYSVDLTSGHWQLFKADGHAHSGPTEPDFSVLCGIVFEFGAYNVPGTPGAGDGVVDLRNIRLDAVPDAPSSPPAPGHRGPSG